jgi:Carboxypeptidase regulatory-like domain
MARIYRSAVLSLLLGLTLGGSLLGQRADRATITGVVKDPAGAAIPEATVTVEDEGTGVETTVSSNEAGSYTTPLLVLGTYTVKVEKTGFKAFVRSGIILTGGLIYRQDAALELGEVSQTVEVTAASEQINVSQGDVSNSVNEKYYEDLPVVMGADIRLAESLLYLHPGYLPMKPNGDPMFRGSQFNSRINGGQTMTADNFFDGAAFGYASGHQQTHESSPPIDAIKEMKVIESTYSAQYGHTSGGFIEYTSKSGTSDLHGSVYEYFANDALNSAGFFRVPGVPKTPQKNNNYGFTLGGPVVIPKVYDGRKKTFFFTNLDILNFRSGVLPGFGNTVPIPAFRNGDFSALLNTANQVGTDALGRPIFDGQIFNPATTRQVTKGVVDSITGLTASATGFVRDPFAGNIIPANDPLRSSVAAKLIPLWPQPDRPGLAFNVAGNPAGDQTWILDAKTWLARIDHQFTPNFKMSHSFFLNERPSIRNCGGVGGCNVRFDARQSPEKNDDYIGDGFYQRIATRHAHQQFDWVIRNNLLNHSTIAYDRWYMGGTPLSAGVGWNQKLGIKGLIEQDAGPPHLIFTGSVPYSERGTYGWTHTGHETNNRWQFSDDLTWIKGKHTIKTGFEYRHHQFNQVGWAETTAGNWNFNRLETSGYDAQGNSLGVTGDAFASFILGQVHSADFGIPTQPSFREGYISPWVNDEIKVTDRLTVNLGLRFEYQTSRTEQYDRYSTFDPTVPNPGAGGRPGALIFAGTGSGRTGTRIFEDPPKDGWGPRFGFAYRLGDKNVIRGGYGIYYAGVPFSQFMGRPTVGFTSNPTAPNLTNGLSPAFYWDDGFPQSDVKLPPFIDPAFGNGTSPIAVDKKGSLTLPRTQNWSLTVERQVSANMVLDLSYIGNRGTRLVNNWQSLGTAANMNDPSVLGLGASLLQADINSPEARAAGIAIPYGGFAGNVAQALRPFPQYQSILYRNVPTGNSTYHSFQTKLDKRFSSGLQFRVAYTFSKLIGDGAESGQSANLGPGGVAFQNPADTHRAERALSQDDVPHVFLVSYTYEFPWGPGKRFNLGGIAGKLFGGWGVSGIQRYESGRPLYISINNDLGGLLFNPAKRPNRVGGGVANLGGNFDPGKDRFLIPSGWADPGPLAFGNAPRHDGTARGFPTFSEDISLIKDTTITERVKFRFMTQFGNIFNRVVYCDPDTNWSSGSFGQVSAQCNTPRSIQFSAKFDF